MKVSSITPVVQFAEILRNVLTRALLCRIAVTVCAFQLVSCGSVTPLFRNSPAVSNRSTQTNLFEQGIADGTDQSLNGSGDVGDSRINWSKSLAGYQVPVCQKPAHAKEISLRASEFIALALPICDQAPLLGVTKSGAVIWWDPASETPFKVFDVGSAPKLAAISTHGLLAAQLENGAVHVWDIASGGRIFTLAKNSIRGRLSGIDFTTNSEAVLLSELSGRVLKVSLTNDNLTRSRTVVEGYAPKVAVLNSAAISATSAIFCSTWDGDLYAFKSLSHYQILEEPNYSVTINGVSQAKESQASAGRNGIPFVKIAVVEDGSLVGVTERGDVEVWSVRGLLKRGELLNSAGGRPEMVAIASGVVGILERDGEVRLVSYKPAEAGMPAPREFFKRRIPGAQALVLGDKGVGYLTVSNGKVLQLNYGRIAKEASK